MVGKEWIIYKIIELKRVKVKMRKERRNEVCKKRAREVSVIIK